MSIRNQLLSTYGAEGIKFFCAILFGVISARVLAPEGRGLVAAAWAGVTIATMIANFGVGKALINRLNEKIDVLDKEDYYGALLVYLPLAFGIGLVAMVLVAPEFAPQERVLAYAILVPATFISLATPIAQGTLRARRRILQLNLIGVVASVSRLMALLAVWTLGGISVMTVLLIELFYWSLIMLGSLFFLRRSLLRRPRFAKVWPALKSLLAYGLSFQVYSVLYGLQLRAAIPIMHRMTGDEATGYFAIGARTAEYLSTLSNQVLFVLLPFMAQMRTVDEALQNTLRLCRCGLFVLVPVAALLIVFAKMIIVGLYGAAFAPAADTFRLLLPGIVIGTLYQYLSSGLVAKGRMASAMASSAIGLLVALGLYGALIPTMAHTGAALAAAGGAATSFSVFVVVLVRFSGVRFSDILLPTKEDITLIFRRE